MPDLGKYADTVLSAYLASLVILALLVVVSWRRSKRVKAQLDALENRMIWKVREYDRAYKRIRRNALEGGMSVLILVAPDCDAICACRILTVCRNCLHNNATTIFSTSQSELFFALCQN